MGYTQAIDTTNSEEENATTVTRILVLNPIQRQRQRRRAITELQRIVTREMKRTGEQAGTALCDHIKSRVYESRMFSDITISFMGKEYELHRIVLSQSSYFMSLLSGPWKENGKAKIQLRIDDPNITHQGLEIALSYLYGISPVLSHDNVVPVLASACFLCVDSLCEMCVCFICDNLRVDTFLEYQHLSERHCYGRHADTIRDACWAFLCVHAATELLHVLPKLSLEVLCRLLKSDEMWVPNEHERFKLAKNALLDWKLAHYKLATGTTNVGSSRRQRFKTVSASKYPRNLRSTKLTPKSHHVKGSPISSNEVSSPLQKDSQIETDFQKLRRLWEESPGDLSNETPEDFDMCFNIFNGGGVIYAHTDVDELLLEKKELEDAKLPIDAINDSIWQNALLHAHIVRVGEKFANYSDEEYLEIDDDEEEDDDEDEDEADFDDEEESNERESGDSTSRITVNTESPKRSRIEDRSLVCFSGMDSDCPEIVNSKRRRTSSGFTWAAKPESGMMLKDFPPLRFGVEYFYEEVGWVSLAKYSSRFYGGSLWNISISKESESGWHFGVNCYSRKNASDPYYDIRKKVRFRAKFYIKTASGFWCVTGTGLRNDEKYRVGMYLTPKDVNLDETLRIWTAVQLIED